MDIMEELSIVTNGEVPFEPWTQDEWLTCIEPTMDFIVENQISIPHDTKVKFVKEIAEYLDDLAEADEDEQDFYMLDRAGSNYMKLIAMAPQVPDPCKVWKAS